MALIMIVFPSDFIYKIFTKICWYGVNLPTVLNYTNYRMCKDFQKVLLLSSQFSRNDAQFVRVFPLQLYVISGFLISDAGFLLQSITGPGLSLSFYIIFMWIILLCFCPCSPGALLFPDFMRSMSLLSLGGRDSVTRLDF